MSVQAIYIVDKIKNTLIFLESLEKDFEINQNELSIILGEIVSESRKVKNYSFSHLESNKMHYFYGVFEKLIIIFQHQYETIPPEELFIELHENFIKFFGNILDNYTNNQITEFRSFVRITKEILSKHITHNEDIINKNSKIDLNKINHSPEKVSVYKRDEVLWLEIKLIKEEYATEFIDGLIFKVYVYINISSSKWFKIHLEFSDYPSKPTIILDENLKRDLEKPLDTELLIYRNWEKSRAPHIIDLIKELEEVISNYDSAGKISTGNEIFKIPALKPLPNIDFLENKREKI